MLMLSSSLRSTMNQENVASGVSACSTIRLLARRLPDRPPVVVRFGSSVASNRHETSRSSKLSNSQTRKIQFTPAQKQQGIRGSMGVADGGVNAMDVDLATSGPASASALRTLFLLNMLPFIGFGFLDNFLMILAGESIDVTLGVYFHLSTMAAAGIGNTISDLAGVGSTHYIEWMVARFTNLKPPILTPQQAASARARYAANVGRGVGVVIGCLLGMLPLLWIDTDQKQKLVEEQEAAERDAEEK